MVNMNRLFVAAQRLRIGYASCAILLCLLCAPMTGCKATVTHRPESKNDSGIRYYESAPYLIVYSDGKGGLNWQIRYLPDQTRIMTATPEVVMAHTEMTLYFQNGVLASSSTTGDTTEIPKALISAVQNAIPLIAALAAEQSQKPGFPAPYLYKMVIHGSKILFIGDQGKIKIQVPILTEAGQ